MKTKNERILVYEDLQGLAYRLGSFNNLIGAYQSLLHEFNSLSLEFNIVTIEDLAALAADPEKFIKAHLAENMKEPPTIAGMIISKEKAVELLELPDLSRIKDLAANCRNQKESISLLEIKGGKISAKDSAQQSIEAGYKFYLSNPHQIEAYNAHLQLIESLNKLRHIFPEYLGANLIWNFTYTDSQGNYTPKKEIWLSQSQN
jgi:hypothetical protein